MVERFVRDLEDNAIRRGSFYNVNDLIGAIDEYINHHNDNQTFHLDRLGNGYPQRSSGRRRH